MSATARRARADLLRAIKSADKGARVVRVLEDTLEGEQDAVAREYDHYARCLCCAIFGVYGNRDCNIKTQHKTEQEVLK